MSARDPVLNGLLWALQVAIIYLVLSYLFFARMPHFSLALFLILGLAFGMGASAARRRG